MSKFVVTHHKNRGRHLRPVDKIYEMERFAEAIIEEGMKTARFTVDGKGSFTAQEAHIEALIQQMIYGRPLPEIALIKESV